jgi:hypothetical protein
MRSKFSRHDGMSHGRAGKVPIQLFNLPCEPVHNQGHRLLLAGLLLPTIVCRTSPSTRPMAPV